MLEMSDFPWDDLLIKIRDRKVIPIVSDGIQVAENQNLSRFLAKSLASRLRLNYHLDTGLRDVSGSFIGNRGRVWRVCLPMDDRAALSGGPTSPDVMPDYGSLN